MCKKKKEKTKRVVDEGEEEEEDKGRVSDFGNISVQSTTQSPHTFKSLLQQLKKKKSCITLLDTAQSPANAAKQNKTTVNYNKHISKFIHCIHCVDSVEGSLHRKRRKRRCKKQ